MFKQDVTEIGISIVLAFEVLRNYQYPGPLEIKTIITVVKFEGQ